MKDLETNKIFASVLVGALIALACGQLAKVLYRPHIDPEVRGYRVAETGGGVDEEVVVIPFPTLLAEGSADAGGKVFKKCVSCHTIDQGAPNKTGPNLYGILGKKKAANADFVYSSAMQASEGAWTIDSMKAFLTKPSEYISGTKMSFNGLRKEEDLANVILYLREQGSTDVPLPEAPAASAEAENTGVDNEAPKEDAPDNTEKQPAGTAEGNAEENTSEAVDQVSDAEESITDAKDAAKDIKAAKKELENPGDAEEVSDMNLQVIEKTEDVIEAVEDAQEAVKKALEATKEAEKTIQENVSTPE